MASISFAGIEVPRHRFGKRGTTWLHAAFGYPLAEAPLAPLVKALEARRDLQLPIQ